MTTKRTQYLRGMILLVAFAVSLTAAGAFAAGSPVDSSGTLTSQGDAGSDGPVESVGGGTDSEGIEAKTDSDDQSNVETNEEPEVGFRDVGYEGQGIVRIAGGVTYLLEDEPHRVTATVETGEWSGDAELCTWITNEADGEDEPRGVSCKSVGTLEEHSVTSTALEFDAWPGNETGATTLHVTVVGDPDGLRPILDRRTMDVHVLAKDDDVSASGLTTQQELSEGTDFLRADTDGDGLTDGQEIREIGTDPLARDTAGNGVPDGMEVMLGTDPTDPWTPHVYLVLLAIPFGVGIIILGAAAGRVERLGRRWESNRSGLSDSRVDRRNDLSSQTDRGQTNFGSSSWSPTQSPDGADQFMTDEERVIRLLEWNDGRMPQSELVEETDWSKSKVSRLLSRMEEDGTITKIPIGRTNLVTLGGREEFANPLLGGEA